MTASEIDTARSQTLPLFLEALPKLPNQKYIRYTSTLIVGRYAKWLLQRPEFIPSLFDFVVEGFAHSEVSMASALAFRYICTDCVAFWLHELERLFATFEGQQGNPNLSTQDHKEILHGIACVVSKTDPSTQPDSLRRLLTPTVAIFQQNLASATPSIDEVIGALTRLKVVLRNCDPHLPEGAEHPVLLVFQALWPILDGVWDQIRATGGNAPCLYKLCTAIIAAIETTKDRFQPCVEPIVNKLMNIYPQDWNPDYLRLMRCFVKFFAKAHPSIFLPVIDHLTLQSFEQFKDGGLHNLPDLVAAYFALLTMYVRGAGPVLCRSDHLDNILACAQAALTIQQTETIAEVLLFWFTLVDRIRTEPGDATTQILVRKLEGLGPGLVQALWDGLIGGIATSRHADIRDVIDVLLTTNTDATMNWLLPHIQAIPADLLSPPEVQQMIADLANADTDCLIDFGRRARHWQKKQRIREQQ